MTGKDRHRRGRDMTRVSAEGTWSVQKRTGYLTEGCQDLRDKEGQTGGCKEGAKTTGWPAG